MVKVEFGYIDWPCSHQACTVGSQPCLDNRNLLLITLACPLPGAFCLTVMVHARSCSFRRTIKGRLRRSLRWWPPHHCSVPPLPPATLVRLISDLHRNTSPTLIPPTNLHSYHCHYQPAPCAIYRSTTRAPPHSTQVPCLRPIISCMHQFLRSWVSVATRTCEDLSQHPLAPFRVWVFSLYVPFYNHMIS